MNQFLSSLKGMSCVFLDTDPVIYYVEQHERYFELVKEVFGYIDRGEMIAVTSPVTLSECLVYPFRYKSARGGNDFCDLLVNGRNTNFV